MSNLWDLSHIQPAGTDVLAGTTIPAMFWNAVDQRGPAVWMRQKKLGIWKSWTWHQTGEAVREMGGWLASGQLKSREDIVEGIETFPETLNKLFTGENFGKLIIKV